MEKKNELVRRCFGGDLTHNGSCQSAGCTYYTEKNLLRMGLRMERRFFQVENQCSPESTEACKGSGAADSRQSQYRLCAGEEYDRPHQLCVRSGESSGRLR